MSFMNEGQGQPSKFDGISLRITISKNEGNPLTNNNALAQISRNQAKFNNLKVKVKFS